MANERNKGKQEQKTHKLNDKLAAVSMHFSLCRSLLRQKKESENSS